MYRILFFIALIVIPIVFSWWLFIPLALLFVYLCKLPYELPLAGFLLDLIYYFGEGFWREHSLAIFSSFLIIAAYFLDKRIHWNKTI